MLSGHWRHSVWCAQWSMQLLAQSKHACWVLEKYWLWGQLIHSQTEDSSFEFSIRIKLCSRLTLKNINEGHRNEKWSLCQHFVFERKLVWQYFIFHEFKNKLKCFIEF